MSTNNHTERAPTQLDPLPQSTPRRHGRAWTALLAAGLLSASMIGIAAGHDPGTLHQGAGTYMPNSPLDDAHLRHIVHYLFDRSSTAQKTQIANIAHAAKADLLALEQRATQARGRRIQLLLQDTLDRGALERTRVEEIQVTDQRSQRVDRLLIDLAEVLTPQQRAQLNAHVQDMAG